MKQPYNWSAHKVSPSAVILPKDEQARILAERDPQLQKRLASLSLEDGLFYQHKFAALAEVNQVAQRWKRKAACKHVPGEIFFPEKHQSSKPAKAICSDCKVRQPCLEYALNRPDEEGIWGGTSKRERQKLRHQLKESA